MVNQRRRSNRGRATDPDFEAAATPARGGIVGAVRKGRHLDDAEDNAVAASAAAAACVTSGGGSGCSPDDKAGAGLRILLLGLERVSGTVEF